jgi:hypothetical protein
MKAVSTVALLVLQAGLAAASTSLCVAQNVAEPTKATGHAAAQSPLTALENEAKEKAAEAALTKVLNDNLPLTLDAKDVYPTVTTLPGGPFSPTPLKLTADQLNQPLAPGDYTINTLDFCSEYSVHQPGAGTAYVLGPYEGKAAGAIGALIWRGTEQYNIAAGNLQAVSWAIQSGLTYDQMPKTYQAIVDQVIPDFKSEITGDFVTNLENTYSSLAQAAKLPPLDTILGKLGEPGQLALDAEKQRQILTAQNTSDELKQQTLFQGQESGIYTPVSAENGPWTEFVKGQVYLKVLVAGGNMATNNVMQIRVMPAPAALAGNAPAGPHLVRAGYGEPQVASTQFVEFSPSNLQGIVGYSQGRGAQALGPVVVVSFAPPEVQGPPAPPAVAQGPPAPAGPVQGPPVPPGPVQGPPVPPQLAAAAETAAEIANLRKSDFVFVSCSGAITTEQLYTAYLSLYLGSATFRSRMDQITQETWVTVVDGKVGMGVAFQDPAKRGHVNLDGNNQGSGLEAPPAGNYAFTFLQGSKIMVVISAQAVQNNSYPTGYLAPDPNGSIASASILQKSKVSVEQPLAYELGQNAWGYSQNSGYTEKPNEGDTNTIMGELAKTTGLKFLPNKTENTKTNAIMSGAAFFDAALPNTHVEDFASDQFLGVSADPTSAAIYYTNKGGLDPTVAEPCPSTPVQQ